MLAGVEQESTRAQLLRQEADEYRQRIMKETQEESQRVREEARESALRESAEIKRHVTYEVQCILSEIDTMRASAQEELDTQRVYADAAGIRATSRDIRAQVLAGLDAPFKAALPANGSVQPPSEPETAEPETATDGVDSTRSESRELVTANGHLEEEPPPGPEEDKPGRKRSSPKDSE